MEPFGLTFELAKTKWGWIKYFGGLKLCQMRPSYSEEDGIPKPAEYGGIKFDLILGGKLKNPIPKFYRWGFWKRQAAFSPWNSGNHLFVLQIPYIIGFFLSVCYGKGENQPGFYIGLKSYEVNVASQGLYRPGSTQKYPYPERIAWGTWEDAGKIYLCLSASMRKDLVD